MIEFLMSCATLLSVGLMSHKEYSEILDALFIKAPEDDLLLDLEYASADINKTISIIRCHNADYAIDYCIFGIRLMEGLKRAYRDYGMGLEAFAEKLMPYGICFLR
jgi:hypothetical protein